VGISLIRTTYRP